VLDRQHDVRAWDYSEDDSDREIGQNGVVHGENGTTTPVSVHVS
jgi:hypothetical protein